MKESRFPEKPSAKKRGLPLGILFILVLVVVLVITLMPKEGDESEPGAVGTVEENGQMEMGTSQGRFNVLDQPAGKTVRLINLNLDEIRWIAVYDERNGERGIILGAGRFRPGDESAVVKLLVPTEVNERYHVVIHKDDGDDKFDHRKDTPAVMNGREAYDTFTAL